MRKYAVLTSPIDHEGKNIYKIMLHQTKVDGVYVFLYDTPNAQFCTIDEWYATIEEAVANWEPLIDGNGWIFIDDPLPDCQEDAFLPLRIKGRDVGAPQWGKYELLTRDGWVDYQI